MRRFALAMPYIASPGAMFAIVFLTEKSSYTFAEQAITAGIVILVLTLILVLLLAPVSSIV
ncbi:MAG: hypothetical protein WBC93_14640 [Sulfitobacter sp.]